MTTAGRKWPLHSRSSGALRPVPRQNAPGYRSGIPLGERYNCRSKRGRRPLESPEAQGATASPLPCSSSSKPALVHSIPDSESRSWPDSNIRGETDVSRRLAEWSRWRAGRKIPPEFPTPPCLRSRVARCHRWPSEIDNHLRAARSASPQREWLRACYPTGERSHVGGSHHQPCSDRA